MGCNGDCQCNCGNGEIYLNTSMEAVSSITKYKVLNEDALEPTRGSKDAAGYEFADKYGDQNQPTRFQSISIFYSKRNN